jgi:uncharacterized membrane protein (DUF2068 family)
LVGRRGGGFFIGRAYSREVDWSLVGCARKGHVTYAPDEPELRDRLMAPTAGGTAWRCLRCGAFVTGGEHGSGPAAAAPLVRRGKEIRSELILRVFAVERFLRFLVIGVAAYGVWWFKYDQAAVQRAYNNALPAIRALYQDLGYDVSHSKLLVLVNHALTISPRWITLLTIGLPVYAVIELVEGIGLWQGRRWGEYFAMIATSVFLPFEVWELARGHITWLKVAAFVINLLLVIYLAWTRRLFGVRGGKPAYDARLRTESVIEMEQAALAAATATPGRPHQAGPAIQPEPAEPAAAPALSTAPHTQAAPPGPPRPDTPERPSPPT